MALQLGSPAIGAGNPALAAALTTDQRGAGYPRIVAGNVDIGAVQTEAPATETPSLVVTTTSDVVNPTDGLTSLREAIAYANSLSGAQTITLPAGLGTITR